jgi:hypothetical protein
LLVALKIIFADTKIKIMSAPSAPKKATWIIGLILGTLGIIGHYGRVDFLTEYNYVLLLAGFIVLAVGTTFRDL